MMGLRAMQADDLDAVCAIEEEAFSVPWSREAMKCELKNEKAHYVVAECEGRVAGYAGFWQVLDEGHVMNVAVAGWARRRGLGEALVQQMLDEGDRLGILYWTLEVRESNRAAILLYEKKGFTSAGLRPNYYEKPREAAHIMWLKRE